MIAVFKREFKSFFQNVTGWVFIAAMLFIASLYFKAYNIETGMSDILYVLVRLLMILIFSVPVLTMRILTEDRKQKIDQLTMTSPASSCAIIVGKYLSMVAVMGITSIIIGAFPLLLSKYTDVDWGTNILAIIGFFLYGSVCIAICMFISSFTESQVISAIISIIAMFVIYLMAGIRMIFNNTGSGLFVLMAKLLGGLDLSERYDIFLSGIFDIKAVVFYISLIAVFVFLTIQSVQKRRYTVGLKNFSVSAFSVIGIVVVCGAVIALNLGVKALPDSVTKTDLTEKKLYSICEATEQVINEIDKPIKVEVYADYESKDEMVDRMLTRYDEMSDYISVEYVNPNTNNRYYENYTDTMPTYNSLFVSSDTRSKVVDYETMYINDVSVNEDGSYSTVRNYDIEGRITSALNYINKGVSAKVYNLTGHDEETLAPAFVNAVEKQNYNCEDIALLGNDIPDDCQLLIVNAPKNDFSDDDADKVLDYVSNGGEILIVLPFSDRVEMPNLSKLLEFYNVRSTKGLVIDTKRYNGTPNSIIPEAVSNIITTGVAGKKPVLAPNSKSIEVIDENDEAAHVIPWLTTSDASFRKNVNIEELADFKYNKETDNVGPLNVAVTASKETKNGVSKAFVIGSMYLFSESANNATANANLTLFTNIVNDCVDDSSVAVVVPVKTMNSEKFVITNSTGTTIFNILFIVLPAALLIAGFVIWSGRRKR